METVSSVHQTLLGIQLVLEEIFVEEEGFGVVITDGNGTEFTEFRDGDGEKLFFEVEGIVVSKKRICESSLAYFPTPPPFFIGN